MLRNGILSVGLGTVLCSLGLVNNATVPAAAAAEVAVPTPTGPSPNEFIFGLSVAGVYRNSFSVGGTTTVDGLTTFHADGTYNSVDDNDQVPGNWNTMTHGIWKRTGPLQLTLRQINHDFDANGALEFFVRTDLVGDFDPNLQGGTFAGSVELFAASQDPLDPNATPIARIPVTGTSQRMSVR